ncbi:MAG: hypothetical protein K6F93_03225 [Lachnospiraceae bacterium]|nr:hypothetical protein [Lachnospiraceae bacterium]
MIGIAVLVSDVDYAEGLDRYLTAVLSSDISFGVYTQLESFESFLRESETRMIFVEEGYDTDKYELPCLRLIRSGVFKGDDGIGMYRSLDSVAQDIMKRIEIEFGQGMRKEEWGASMLQITDPEGDSIDQTKTFTGFPGVTDGCLSEESNLKITGICSPIGGAFSSTFAFGLALYHSKGARTLFVSFDPFFETVIRNDNIPKNGIGKLIYLLDGERDYAIEKCTRRIGGLDCIIGADHWTDICDMKTEYATKLLTLAETEGYKNLILDIKLFGEASVPLLRSSQKILVPGKNASGEDKRIDEWKRQLYLIGIAPEKISCVEVPYDPLISKGCEPLMLLKGRLGRFVEETEGMRYVR